ncbi:TrkH family potassium uptake protein [Leucobacter sp. GX24907]
MHSSPPRLAILVFSSLIIVWTALLSLPIASSKGESTPLVDAFFTAVSAICVTGLSTVDMGDHWSIFGDLVILVGFQIGGIGVLTLASILGLTVMRRLGLRQRLLAAGDSNPAAARRLSEGETVGLGNISGLLGAVAISLLVIEGTLTLLIAPRLMIDGAPFHVALLNAFYLSASAFTNTGFVPMHEGLAPYATDTYLLSMLAIGVFLGAIGFPVLLALFRVVARKGLRSNRRLGLHSRLTLATTLLLVILGWLAIAGLEANNTSTLGHHPAWETILSAGYTSVMTRSGGLAIIDPSTMNSSTLLVMDMLMFVGGGSASTAGGIKVTTLAVLFLAAYAEARGYRDIQAFGRRIPDSVLRIAVSVLIWGTTIVIAASVALLHLTGESLDHVLFEVISAFGTCGLSTGLSPNLPDAGKYILAAVMWSGRVGTITLAAAVASTNTTRFYRLPEERPIVG